MGRDGSVRTRLIAFLFPRIIVMLIVRSRLEKHISVWCNYRTGPLDRAVSRPFIGHMIPPVLIVANANRFTNDRLEWGEHKERFV